MRAGSCEEDAAVTAGVLASMISRSDVNSSAAESNFPLRMSDASFPQCADTVRSGSVARIR